MGISLKNKTEGTVANGKCVRTFSGKVVDVMDPNPDMIVIDDVGHALSNLCRFGGHSNQFYSVAQHSVRAAHMAEHHHKFTALMHDAAEAYLMDLPKPIKNCLPEYKLAEHNLMIVISAKFGFEWPLPEAVEWIDKKLLEHEWLQLMAGDNNSSLLAWTPEFAKRNFLEMYYSLKGKGWG